MVYLAISRHFNNDNVFILRFTTFYSFDININPQINQIQKIKRQLKCYNFEDKDISYSKPFF